ncbi:zinc dependent phospholipase C family protein [Clostridium sp. WILCCON 0269]|uniref:Zinc dependent phospholipase C family protein n=1 Tax=Candidatus Clostridium eludens TaxID=3381663 RepID=A0ABW8SG56_9CLOT
MIINTHILISNIIYNYCSEKLNIKLNKWAFTYGNIKPDFIKDKSKYCHCINESINVVSEYSQQLIHNKMSIKNYSITLGILCHFICDYFCLYHTEKYKNKNLFQHLIYEIALHFAFIKHLICGKLRIIINDNIPKKDIVSIINDVYKKYDKENKFFTNDINYAISAGIMAVELIVSCDSFKYNSEKNSRKIS